MRWFMRIMAVGGIVWAVIMIPARQPFDAMMLMAESWIVLLAAKELEERSR